MRQDRRRRYDRTSKAITVNIDTELLAHLDDWVIEHGGARSGWIAIMVRAYLEDGELRQSDGVTPGWIGATPHLPGDP